MSNSNVSREEREHLRHLRDVHFREQNGRCYFCDVQMTSADVPDPKPDTTVTIEHLKGRASGDGSNYLNTAASCLGCNNKRSKQRQVGKRTVPKVKVVRKRMFTYVYTTPKGTVCARARQLAADARRGGAVVPGSGRGADHSQTHDRDNRLESA